MSDKQVELLSEISEKLTLIHEELKKLNSNNNIKKPLNIFDMFGGAGNMMSGDDDDEGEDDEEDEEDEVDEVEDEGDT
jgi:hypothetical protein